MDEETVLASAGSEPINTPTDLNSYDLDMEDASPAAATVDPADEQIEAKSEPDDLALAEGEEDAELQIDEPVAGEPILANDDMVVEIDGEKIAVKDLKSSRLLEADYTRSKQALAQERSGLQELGANFQSALERMGEYLFSKLPPEPDANLAFTNPNLHYQQNMLHQAALAEMMQVMQVKQGAEQAKAMLDESEFKALMSESNSEIIKQMPHLKDPKRFDAFNRRVETGAKQYGFTDAEIKATADPRIRQMAYDAAYGREARANAAKAKAKVQSAAPMLPVQRSASPSGEKSSQIAAAQKRFDTNPTPDNLAALMAVEG